MTESLVALRKVRKDYGGLVALNDVDLSIEQGQFVVLLGPSGSGKTTLLSILGGFTKPTSGEVRIAGQDVTLTPPARRPTVTVFQDYALFPHMIVRDNIGFGLAMRKVPRAERARRVEEVLTTVGLEGLGGRRIHQLSGGQRQRVALARAIVVEPAVLLLDEPLGALDLKIRQQMQEELVQLQRRIETTFVHVTHDQEEAMNIADIVVVINRGTIEDMGPPERVYLRPASLFTATFMGDSNILTGRATAANGAQVTIETALGALIVDGRVEAGSTAHLSVRPEQLRIGTPDGEGMIALGEAVITDVVFQGAHRRCHAQSGANREVELLLRLPPEQHLNAGDSVPIQARAADLVLLRD
jgi:spermidine/putrescine transport system ATP-binding protein